MTLSQIRNQIEALQRKYAKELVLTHFEYGQREG